MSKKTILVTGATGFIGNCFAKLILKERPDWRVLNVDVCTYAANPSTIKEELKTQITDSIKQISATVRRFIKSSKVSILT